MFKILLKFKSKFKTNDISYIGKKTPIWKPALFLIPSLALLIYIMIIPMITTTQKAFLVPFNAHKVGNESFGLDNFEKMFNNFYFKKSLSNSLLYAILVVPISIAISLVISVAISNIIRKKARSAAQTIFFIPYVTSIIAISMAFMYLFATSGIVNKVFGIKIQWLTNKDSNSYTAFFVILIQGIWTSLAFQILIFTTAILGVEEDRYKAASIDGAGPVKQFFAITLPSINRTLSFVITVGLIAAIKIFPLALFNNNPSNAALYGGSTLMMFVYQNVSPQGGVPNYYMASAAAVILVFISISFNIVVKNLLKIIGMIFRKVGEHRVKSKIKISKI